jgi:hypothetical protein
VHVAGLHGDVSGLTVLQGLGADVYAKTLGAGWTPFHYAAAPRAIPTVQWLLKQGADVNAATSGSETALHFAAMGGLVRDGGGVNRTRGKCACKKEAGRCNNRSHCWLLVVVCAC